MFSTVYASLFLLTTLYAIYLDWFNRRMKLDLAWIEVVIGVSICLAAAACQARMAPPGHWQGYERIVLWAFIYGGAPIVLWQIGRLIVNVEGVLDYHTRRTDADRTEEMAQDSGSNAAGDPGDRRGWEYPSDESTPGAS